MSRCPNRRSFLQQSAFAAAAFTTPGLFAEELARTPRQTEGPFYPDHLPLDTDNDLLIINDSITPAVGKITHMSGRVVSTSGEPVRNAVVEIWEADQEGVYIHSQSPGKDRADKNFQGFGRFLTASTGEYYFRTIKPTPYGPRTAHIHVAVIQNGKRMLTTECCVRGEPKNEDDPVLGRIRDPSQREMLIRNFERIPNSRIEEFAVKFDLVIGDTPEEPERRRRR